MQGLKNILLEEQKHLNKIIETVGENNNDISVEGSLRISVDKGNARYYHCKGGKYEEYISKKNEEFIKQLAQKTYNSNVAKIVTNRLKNLEQYLKDYKDDEIDQLYLSLHTQRQALVTPVEPTITQLEEEWLSESYIGKEFQEGTPVIMTERGERVRSKSEKILADCFFRKNIPYKYEKPLKLQKNIIVYPDFTFFSKRLREEVYWEHEGMMDNPEYARSAIRKINTYQMNGIFPGERLILTYETEHEVLNSALVNKLIEKYLL